jgi:cytochrome o ubiquinol oxidase operon protein cyoD
MSPDPHASHGAHDDHAEPHGSMRDYAIGFILSVILTAIPFWLVMAGPLPATTTAALVMGFAAVQMIVHMIFFLHMNGKVEGGWTMTALLFTIIIVIIMMSGSLWVMYHLNTNMMPSIHDMRQMP